MQDVYKIQLQAAGLRWLKGIEKPIGISEYQLTRAIPENLKIKSSFN
jgi:hypothetical protein